MSELREVEESIYDSDEGRTIIVFEEWHELRGARRSPRCEVEAGSWPGGGSCSSSKS